MKFAKLKAITASAIIVLGSQAGHVLAGSDIVSQRAYELAAESTDRAPAATQAPAARPAPRPGYRGYPPRYDRRYYRDTVRPFGSSGPSFRGPWKSGSGPGFSSGGPSFGSGGPSFGSSRGPRYGSWDDWGPEPFYDEPFFDDPYFDRGPRAYDRGPRAYERGPRFYDSGPGDWDWGGSGMGFGW